jgi:hypothetical protein
MERNDHRELIAAVHQLEMNLSDRIHLQTTALEVNNERLENLRIAVDRHRIILFGNEDGERPGLLVQMNEMQKSERERRLTLRGVVAAFIALVGKFLWDIWHI